MILRFRRARRAQSPELNITAFMNLMVALVPFLLITLVFTQMAVQEMNLPENATLPADAPPPQLVTITVRRDSLTVGDMQGAIQVLKATNGAYDLAALGNLLMQIKTRLPNEQRVALLLEPDISYDTLIQVFDTARYVPNESPQRDLFPHVLIGDAP